MKSVIIGAYAYGEALLAYLKEVGVEVVGFLDNIESTHGNIVRGVPVLGKIDLLDSLSKTHDVHAVYCPIGNNRLRVQHLTRARELGYETPTFVHQTAKVEVKLDQNTGIYILTGATVGDHVGIGDFSMLCVGVDVAHNVKLGMGVFLSTGAKIREAVATEDFACVGVGATIMEQKTLGYACLVNTGAVVTNDVLPRVVVAGNPARVLECNNFF